jgi:uncharacterized repeat protein (TIGR02543 family)
VGCEAGTLPLDSPLEAMTTTVLFRRAASLFFALVWFSGNVVSADQFGDFTYADDGASIAITGFPTNNTGNVVIPSSVNGKPVTSIGSNAFAGCSMGSVTIPNSVTYIGFAAFSNCNLLADVRLGSGVTTIGKSAFIFSGLGHIVIPASVTTIDQYAFYDCNLRWATFQGNAPTSLGGDAFSSQPSGFRVYYTNGAAGFDSPTWDGNTYYGHYPSAQGSPPQITSTAPPATGKVGFVYSHSFSTAGGPPPVLTLTAGALPVDFGQGSEGYRLHGFPSAPGIFTATITASNGIPPDATQTFSIDTNEYRSLLAGGTNGTVTGGTIHLLNSTATLTATPSPGYLFASWTGDATGTDNPLSVLMDADKAITASFTPDTNDTDSDGWTNYEEIVVYDSDPILWDTDTDGAKDSLDAFPRDPAETLDTDHDGTGDNADSDDDGDGYSDDEEINIHHTNPKRADSDGDGLSDPAEIQTHLTNPNIADTDNDGLNDGAEVNTYHTLPKVGDTDEDGFLDGYEVLTGKLPLDPLDKPALVAEARTAIEFTFPAAIGKTYRIESSTDLSTWGPVESGIVGTGAQVQRFYSTRGLPKRYFRVEEDAP